MQFGAPAEKQIPVHDLVHERVSEPIRPLARRDAPRARIADLLDQFSLAQAFEDRLIDGLAGNRPK